MAIKNEADPRVIRTRRLLQDALTSLIREKAFDSITVKDITERATVNRATFYAHFTDKFEILESKITDTYRAVLARRISGRERLDEASIRSVFLALCEFHRELSDLCPKSYNALGFSFEHQIKEITRAAFYSFMTNEKTAPAEDAALLHTASILLSWGLYGAAYAWNQEGRRTSLDAFVEQSLPLVMHGIGERMPPG